MEGCLGSRYVSGMCEINREGSGFVHVSEFMRGELHANAWRSHVFNALASSRVSNVYMLGLSIAARHDSPQRPANQSLFTVLPGLLGRSLD